MGKIKIFIVAIFSFFIITGFAQHLLACEQGSRELLQSTYHSQIGVREATGKNDGIQVEKYLRYTKLGKGFAWCAAFVCWSMGEACVINPRSAWSPDLFAVKKVIYQPSKNKKSPPLPGDVFGIYFQTHKRIAHVGFIDEWEPVGVYAITVEGNTNEAGSREGDGVYRKRRLKKQIYAVSRYI